MKTLTTSLLILLSGLAYSQPFKEVKYDIDETYKRDSIIIENIVEFYESFDRKNGPSEAVRFKIRITNLGSRPIPNLLRVSNTARYLKLFYNDKDSYDINLMNGTEGYDKPWSIEKNESDTFGTGFALRPGAGIFRYENPIHVRWNYMGIDSPVLVVDVVNRKIIEE